MARIKNPSERHFSALDGARGLAVLAVFLYHYGGGRQSSNLLLQAVGFVSSIGWAGVVLFFVLSGFLITGILWDARGEAHWLRNFYVRRALRILPLYYGSLLLILLLSTTFDHSLSFGFVARVVGIHALYLQNIPWFNFYFKQTELPFWIEHYWTLAVEEQFYLLWPMLLLLTRSIRQALWMCAAVIVASVAYLCYTELQPGNVGAYYHSLPANAAQLACGGVLALCLRSDEWPRVRRVAMAVGAVALVLVLAGTIRTQRGTYDALFQHIGGTLGFMLAFSGLIAAVVEPGVLCRVFSVRWLRWLGRISFGTYIFHLLFVKGYRWLTIRLTGHQDDTVFFGVRAIIGAGLTLLIAWLSFRYYERPFLRLKHRFAAHAPKPPESAAEFAQRLSAE